MELLVETTRWGEKQCEGGRKGCERGGGVKGRGSEGQCEREQGRGRGGGVCVCDAGRGGDPDPNCAGGGQRFP